MGDRKVLIGRAAAQLAAALCPARLYLSDYFESEPWGYVSTNSYLNRGILIIIEKHLNPLDILDITQSVEQAIGHGYPHRNVDGSYCDRPIDIDIIDIDGIEMHHPRLILPHPRASQRPFVTIPMAALNLLHP